MDWIESILKIRDARDNNRLIIFVGAGVSKNSDIPTWSELIQSIAEKIEYKNSIFEKELSEYKDYRNIDIEKKKL